MITKKAAIEWPPEAMGGRTKPTHGIGAPRYSTVVRFVDEPWPSPSGAWSLMICKDERLSDEYQWIADVHYLVPEAPHDSLREGRRFELYEGKKRVALGRVLGP